MIIIECPCCHKRIDAEKIKCTECNFDLSDLINNKKELMFLARHHRSVDPDLSFGYFMLAAKLQDDTAMYELGFMYRYNACTQARELDSHTRNKRAQYCFAKSAMLGNFLAREELMKVVKDCGIISPAAYSFIHPQKIHGSSQLFYSMNHQAFDEEKMKKNSLEEIHQKFVEKKQKEIVSKNTIGKKEKIENIVKRIDSVVLTKPILSAEPKIKLLHKFFREEPVVRIDEIPNYSKLKDFELKIEELKEKIRNSHNKKGDDFVVNKVDPLFARLEKEYLNKVVFHNSDLKTKKGIITKLEPFPDMRQAYATVVFENENEEHKWVIPDAFSSGWLAFIDKWVFTEPAKGTYEYSETEKEINFMRELISICLNNFDYADNQQYKTDIELPRFLDNIPEDYFERMEEIRGQQYKNDQKSHWINVAEEPFFASIKTKQFGLCYIGKSEIEGKVIAWRDPRASTYYHYATALGNENIGLLLVRDHKIANRRYLGFIDKFNLERKDFVENKGLNVKTVNDAYLLKLLEDSREEKKTHDIIKTIQDNQYKIISDVGDYNMLVTGCAGSGKTMVLFHRIAYIAFNDDNYNPNKYLVISSNPLLNEEAIKLSNELEISSILNIDSNNLYFNYCSNFIKENESAFVIEKFISSQNENSSIYSINYLKNILEKVDSYRKVKDNAFYNFYLNKLKDLYKAILNVEIGNIVSIRTFVKTHKKDYELVRKLPKGNLQISTDKKEECKFILEHLSNFIADEAISNNKGEIYKSISTLSVYKLVEKSLNGIKYSTTSIINPLVKGNSKMVYLYDTFMLYQMSENFLKCVDGDLSKMIFEIIDFVVSKTKEFQANSLMNKNFIFVYCLKELGLINEKFDRIFVDEYQNYSFSELSFIKSLSANGTINLFGDEKQKIESKGILKDQLNSLGNFKEFELNVDYRNAKQITEYLNKAFKMKLIPIGVEGVVQNQKTNDELHFDLNNDRIALIVKNVDACPFINKPFINIIKDSSGKIERNLINLISIDNVKGLEFEVVYVYEEGMNENERYLACSRALNKLVVID